MDSPTELSDYTLRSFTRAQPRRQGVHDPGRGASRRRPRRIDEYAAGAEKIVNEAAAIFGEFPDVRNGHLHVPRRLRAVGRRRRHGASQQHGRRGARRRSESAGGARRARHRVARVLPLLERRAYPPEDRSSRSTSKRPTCPVSCGSPKASRSITAADHGAGRRCRRPNTVETSCATRSPSSAARRGSSGRRSR